MDESWKCELERWLAPFLAALGHKVRARMCPAYVAGLIGAGDRKSIRHALRSAQSDIDALRDRVARLQDERNSLEAAPRACADIGRYVDDWISRAIATQPYTNGPHS